MPAYFPQRLPEVLPACPPDPLPGDSVLVLELSCVSSGFCCSICWLWDVVGGVVGLAELPGCAACDLFAAVLLLGFWTAIFSPNPSLVIDFHPVELAVLELSQN